MFPTLLSSTLEFICISSLGCLVCYMVLVSSLCPFLSVSQFSQSRLHVVLSVCLPSHVPCSLSVCLLFYCQVYTSLFGSQSVCHFLFHFDGPLSHVHSVQFVSPVSLCLICACCAPVCFQFPYHPSVYIFSQLPLVPVSTHLSLCLPGFMVILYFPSLGYLLVSVIFVPLCSAKINGSPFVIKYLFPCVVCAWVLVLPHTICSRRS